MRPPIVSTRSYGNTIPAELISIRAEFLYNNFQKLFRLSNIISAL